jgi:predicted acylesterase/phospholipase RssA
MDWKPTIVVLGPGGMKGFLELGALALLEEKNYLSEVKTYAGVSVGAMISLMLVAGYTVTDVISDATSTNLFQDVSSINLSDIKKNIGLLSNKYLKDRLTERIMDKFGLVPSLEGLYQATGVSLVTVTYNVDLDEVWYLSKQTHPHLSCIDAVMLSINIPLVFQILRFQGYVFADGALGNPYPIDLFDDGATDILGIYITSNNPSSPEPSDGNIARYLYRIIHSPMSQLKKRITAHSTPRCKHLTLYSPTLDMTGLTIDLQMKAEMVVKGYMAATEFVNKLTVSPV